LFLLLFLLLFLFFVVVAVLVRVPFLFLLLTVLRCRVLKIRQKALGNNNPQTKAVQRRLAQLADLEKQGEGADEVEHN
jgi:cytochrome c-type biogenesis protein CcmH/NrfG